MSHAARCGPGGVFGSASPARRCPPRLVFRACSSAKKTWSAKVGSVPSTRSLRRGVDSGGPIQTEALKERRQVLSALALLHTAPPCARVGDYAPYTLRAGAAGRTHTHTPYSKTLLHCARKMCTVRHTRPADNPPFVRRIADSGDCRVEWRPRGHARGRRSQRSVAALAAGTLSRRPGFLFPDRKLTAVAKRTAGRSRFRPCGRVTRPRLGRDPFDGSVRRH
jgi:hypothetical protein